MRQHVENIVRAAIQEAMDASELKLAHLPDVAVERPRDPDHGDWATSVALRLARELKSPPFIIAEKIAAHIQHDDSIASVEVAGPGFINLRLSNHALQQVIRDARELGSDFGRCDVGFGDSTDKNADKNAEKNADKNLDKNADKSANKNAEYIVEARTPDTVNVEFISANPTGPMHVGHGRWAALGNALCHVLEHAGCQVTREFYVNDAGLQMDLFGLSIVVRYQQLCGLDVTLEENHYAGSYIIDLARSIFDTEGTRWLDASADERLEYFREFGYQQMLEHMKEICAKAGVSFDVWSSERALYEPKPLGGVDSGSSPLGGVNPAPAAPAPAPAPAAPAPAPAPAAPAPAPAAPAPAPAAPAPSPDSVRSDPTAVGFSETKSLAPSPIDRMFQTLDECGYLYHKDGATWFRTTDFGDDKDRVLIKADGAYTYFAPDIAYHIDKFERGSEYLINIWGADHHGYIPRMQAACAALGHEGKLTVVLGQLVNLFRGGEAVRMSKRTGELVTFEELLEEVGADATKYLMLTRSSDQAIDFDIEAAKRQDSSNPVYYVQYAHARICSLLRMAASRGVSKDTTLHETLAKADLSLLAHPTELDLARVFARLTEVVEACAHDLAPFRLTHYAEELATMFHRFYTECQVIGADDELTIARLYLADATRNVLAVTLGLLGVSAPERM